MNISKIKGDSLELTVVLTARHCLCQPAPSARGVLRWQITVTSATCAAVGSHSYADNGTRSGFSGCCGMEKHVGAWLAIKSNTVVIIT